MCGTIHYIIAFNLDNCIYYLGVGSGAAGAALAAPKV